MSNRITSWPVSKPDGGFALVLAIADVDPVVTTIGGFHDEVVVIRVEMECKKQLFTSCHDGLGIRVYGGAG